MSCGDTNSVRSRARTQYYNNFALTAGPRFYAIPTRSAQATPRQKLVSPNRAGDGELRLFTGSQGEFRSNAERRQCPPAHVTAGDAGDGGDAAPPATPAHCFFHRSTAELCAAITDPDAPASAASLQAHIARIADPRLQRAFAAAVDVKIAKTGPAVKRVPAPVDLWRGLGRRDGVTGQHRSAVRAGGSAAQPFND